MRLVRENWRGKSFAGLDEGVAASVSPADPYAVDGAVEQLRHEVDRLASMMGVMAVILERANLLSAKDVQRLTDYQYEAAE